MKKLLYTLILSLSPFVAQAKPNALCLEINGGGKVVAVTAKENAESRPSFFIMGGGKTVTGQWTLLGERTLMIEWEDGSKSTFDLLEFKLCNF